MSRRRRAVRVSAPSVPPLGMRASSAATALGTAIAAALANGTLEEDVLGPAFAPPPMLDSIQVQLDPDDLANADSFSLTAREIVFNILLDLDFVSLCRLQRVSRCWYEFARSNALWFAAAQRALRDDLLWQGGTLRELVRHATTDAALAKETKWKRELRRAYARHRCRRCNYIYREAYNTSSACARHTGVYDLLESGPGPTGVKWSCCFARGRDATACYRVKHIAEDGSSK